MSQVYRHFVYDTVSVDISGRWQPDIQVVVLEWDYKSIFTPGEFETVTCVFPCTEFSVALTARPRNLPMGDCLAQKALKIVLFETSHWWIENSPTGLLKSDRICRASHFQTLIIVSILTEGTKNPPEFGGDEGTISKFQGKLCDGRTCPNLRPPLQVPILGG